MDMRKYDTGPLQVLLNIHGLEKTWHLLLKKHIQHQDQRFAYILNDSCLAPYSDDQTLERDFLEGLTIANIGVLYEFSLSHCDVGSRKTNGQFFTPDDVAEVLVRESKNVDNGIGKWLDPCSGVGNLTDALVGAQDRPEAFLRDRMLVADKDPLALFIARVLLTLKYQNEDPGLFFTIEKNFREYDFLSVPFSTKPIPGFLKHSFVIANPPYVSKVKDSRFLTASCEDTYAFFLENIIHSSQGFVAIVPQSFTHASKFQSLRNMILGRCYGTKLFNMDNVPDNVFTGIKFGSTTSNIANSIRPTIISARCGLCHADNTIRTTTLLRWKKIDRRKIFNNLERFLSDPIKVKHNQLFPKVSQHETQLLEQVRALPTLASIATTRKPTGYPLYVPASPRYFISASKLPLSRSSLKTLYFNNENDRNHAYLLLNSSFAYWWWRSFDGGMMLSLENLFSLPLLEFERNPELVKKLEKSDTINKSYVTNAGKVQENVKRPTELTRKITDHVAGCWAEHLSKLHENSYARLLDTPLPVE